MPATCPGRDELHAYSVGLLSDEASDTIAAHVASCPDCRAGLATFDSVEDTLLNQLRRPAVADPFLEESQCQVAVARACHVSEASHAGCGKRSLCGTTLGEYQLISELGQGGMGTVYKALHMKLDRVVALKVLSRSGAADGPAISRFEREMRAVGKISHPNVVQAYDAREIDGMPVLIMEFIDGLDMAQIVRRSGPLAVADACEVVRRTALGLQQAHEHGLVHRDIKPSNIMLTKAGEVKLLDLGLARFYAESAAGEEMTGTGQALGTADYMAPEQASDSHSVDIRADLYSLGCTLYKLLAGRAPFSGPGYASVLDKMNAHVHQPVPPIREFAAQVPDGLAALLDRLLAKCPAERLATPAEVVAALEPFCDGANLAALVARAAAEESLSAGEREEQVVTPSPSPVRRRRWPILRKLLLGLAFLGSLAAAFAAGILFTMKRDSQPRQVAVPANSRTTIDQRGNAAVRVTAAPSSVGTAKAREWVTNGPSRSEMLSPATPETSEQKILQGRWKAFRVEPGKNARTRSSMYVHEDVKLLTTEFLEFRDWGVEFRQKGNDRALSLGYGVDPTKSPKTITMHPLPVETGIVSSLEIYGIYKLQDDELTMAIRVGGPRPNGFDDPYAVVFILGKVRFEASHVGEPPAATGSTTLVPRPSQPSTSWPAFLPAPPMPQPGGPSRSAVPLTPVTVQAAEEMKALQGKWKVIGIEEGKNADVPFGAYRLLNPRGTDFLSFQDWRLGLWRRGTVQILAVGYRVDSTSSLKTIDLDLNATDRCPTPATGPFQALGIYELKGTQLRICLAFRQTSSSTIQRPTRFSAEPNSKDVLLVLERCQDHPLPDETAIQGNWEVITETTGGIAVHPSGPTPDDRPYYAFSKRNVSRHAGRRSLSEAMWDYFLASNTITMRTRHASSLASSQDLNGIYKLENDELTIAYREGGPRPEKFESPAGSNVTLLNLRRVKGSVGLSANPPAGAEPSLPRFPSSPFPSLPRTTSAPAAGPPVGVLTTPVPAPEMRPGAPPTVNGVAPPPLRATSPLAPQPVHVERELKLLQGEWKVVRVEKGKRGDRTWAAICSYDLPVDPATTMRLEFRADMGNTLIVKRRSPSSKSAPPEDSNEADPYWYAQWYGAAYRLDPTAWQKRMDILAPGGSGVAAVGVYEIQGEQLRIHLVRRVPEIPEEAQRPNAFAFDPESGDILFVLERYRDEEEKKIRGWWSVVTQTVNGVAVPEAKRSAQRWLFDEDLIVPDGVPDAERVTLPAPFVLEADREPKRITLLRFVLAGGKSTTGIYRLSGDRLHIAYRQDGSLPQDFESRPGSNVTVWELRRLLPSEPAARPPKSEGKGESKGSPPAGASAMPSILTPPTMPPVPGFSPPEVNVVRPVVRQVTPHEDLPGRLEAAQTAEIRSRVTGHVAKVLFKPGATVKQSDLLFELDSAPFQAELDKCQAEVRLAELLVKRTTAELKDAQKPSPSERQRLEARQAEAEATLTAAQKGLRVAQLNLESTRLTAPIAGKIGRPLVLPGNSVLSTTTLATIDSVDPIGVIFCPPEPMVLSVLRRATGPNQEAAIPVFIRLGDETSFARAAKLESADTHIDPATRTATWRATLPNPDGLLIRGMFVDVRLITGKPYQAILVPETAIHDGAGGQFVYVVTDQNVVQRRTVKTGDKDDWMRVVKEGVTADDWVISENPAAMPWRDPYLFLREIPPPQWHDGSTVKPRKTQPAAPQPSSEAKPSKSSTPSK